MTAAQAISWLHHLSSEEPVFVLRAQDPLAVRAIDRWLEDAALAKVPILKLEGALIVLDQFKQWPIKQLPR